MPMAIGQAVNRLWLYGDVMCKLTYYLQGVSVGASVFTITVMSIDRYLAIRRPIAFRKVFNRRSTIMVIVALWGVSLLLFAPLLVVRQTSRVLVENADHQLIFCVEQWGTPKNRRSYSILCFVLVYAVPGSIVILAYSLMGRRLCAASLLQQINAGAAPGVSRYQAGGERLVRDRKRVAKILLLLAILFALCWLPYNILNLLLDLDESRPNAEQIFAMLPFTLLLGHANSAINPLLYCFLTRNFRNTVRQIFSPICKCCRVQNAGSSDRAAISPLNQNGHACSTYQFRRYKNRVPLGANVVLHDCQRDGSPNQMKAPSSELIEMRGVNRAASSPGVECAATHSSSSYTRGRQTHSSSSGYDSCPAGLTYSSNHGGTHSMSTLSNTNYIDHSPHRKCFLRHSRHLSTLNDSSVPISAQQCHF
ncbi:Hypothetical predicted protein [Cloeon dipterum]|uniref:G-protein coupled receptors family 1 profile domain-containing protein n=1 Tax=Cloeon dipterum TaxID=197152 RepID=A0A8S1CQU3_9INSE|nr:Hypothetical predicted protein [Cloeon dipterum]